MNLLNRPSTRWDDDLAPDRLGRPVTLDPARLEALGLLSPRTRRSRLAEEIRLIKRRLIQQLGPVLDVDLPLGAVLMVTSARPGEGRSFVAANLALSFALDEQVEAVLVEADVHTPTLGHALGLPQAPGLVDLLSDPTIDPDHALLIDDALGLTLLAAGRPVTTASHLFGSHRAKDLLRALATLAEGSVVIVDTPPLLTSTEALALTQAVDHVVLVVEADRTSRADVGSALDMLENVPGISLVLNKALPVTGGGLLA